MAIHQLKQYTKLSRTDILAVILTLNQKRAILPVVDPSFRQIVVTRQEHSEDGLTSAWYPEALCRILSLPFTPVILIRAVFEGGYRRLSFMFAADNFLYAYGRYVFFLYLLRKTRPRLILFGNDHEVKTRTLLMAARKLRLRTAYIQHATVNETFPPLQATYALLHGRHSARCYDQPQSKSTVFLTGPTSRRVHPREDDGRPKQGTIVGIAVNQFDSLPRIEEVLAALADIPRLTLVVRMHPRTGQAKRTQVTGILTQYGAELSIPSEEDAEDFVHRCDLMVAGESAIHLEAALHGTEPIYYDFSQTSRDHYGFLRDGLIRYQYSSAPELAKMLREYRPSKDDVLTRAKEYSHDVGTGYQGYGAKVGRTLISQLVANRSWHQDWRSLRGFQYLDVFEYNSE